MTSRRVQATCRHQAAKEVPSLKEGCATLTRADADASVSRSRRREKCALRHSRSTPTMALNAERVLRMSRCAAAASVRRWRRRFLLVLVLAAGGCGGQHLPVDARPGMLPPPWDFYHTTETIFSEFARMAAEHSGVMKWQQVKDKGAFGPGGGGTGRAVNVATITDFSVPDDGKAKLLMVCGEHAREIITAELALWLARVLVGEDAEYETWDESRAAFVRSMGLRPPPMRGLEPLDVRDWVRWILSRVVVKLVPIEVPTSRLAVENGKGCLRKTVNEVDLNRNWPVGYRPMSTAAKHGSDEYPGPHPFSEPESRIVRDEAARFKPHGYANVHSGEWAMYVPWDHKPAFGEDLPRDTNVLLDRLNEHCECVSGAAGQVSGYLAYGTSMDYLYSELKVPYPLTIEVWGENGEGKRPRNSGGMLRGGGTVRRGRRRALFDQANDFNRTHGGVDVFESAVETPGVEGQIEVQTSRGHHARRLRSFTHSAERCIKMFNPANEHEYREVMANWINVILLFADHLIKNYHVDQPSTSPPLQPPLTQSFDSEAEAATVEDIGAQRMAWDGELMHVGGSMVTGAGEVRWILVVTVAVAAGAAAWGGRRLFLKRQRRWRRLETRDK